MKRALDAVRAASSALAGLGGAALVFLMMLTMADVVLRLFGRPIVGTYELVAMSAAVAIGAALPMTSWMRGHIYVDAFLTRLPRPARAAFNLVTRAMVFVLFGVIGWNLVKYAIDLARSGEVSPTLRLPFWPIVLGVAAGCFVQCVVVVGEVARILRGEYE
jgi:TRAP-type C4-dicarboxylate transport system permease small subunit